MFLLTIHLAWLILFLLILNFVGVNILGGEDRFWLPPIVLWLFLFMVLIVIRQLYTNDVALQQAVYDTKAGADATVDYLNQRAIDNTAKEGGSFFHLFIHLLGIQSVLAALSQLYGFRQTGKPYYRSALLTFLALSFLYLVVGLLYL
jgi:hypothetical protein